MLLKNAMACDYRGVRKVNVRIQDRRISDVGNVSAQKGEREIDLKGKLLMPSMLDLNIAPKSLALSQKTLTSLACKAFKGGVGNVLLYPYTHPSCSEHGSIELIKSFNTHSPVRFIPSIAALNNADKISDITTLHTSGGSAIFAQSDINSHTFMRIAQYAQMLNLPLICFCQDRACAEGVMHEGLLAAELGLPSIPPYSQTKEVAKVAEMLKDLSKNKGLKVVFDTLVYPRSLEIVQSYDTEHFYTQSSIHHLILDESLCQNYNTAAKLNPPLVDKKTQQELLEALLKGYIHTLTSLQCAEFNSKKDQVFELAPFGTDSLEIYFSLLYTYLHKGYDVPLEAISKMTSFNPARILNVNCGAIESGMYAALMVIDPQAQFKICDSFSPYDGQILQGVVELLISGDHIYDKQSLF